MRNCLYLALLVFLPACSLQKNNEKNKQSNVLIDLVASTKIIRSVIAQNKLNQLLEEHDPEQLNLLIDNFSPAQMAFESEVLSTTMPLVLVYYYREDVKEKEFIEKLEQLAIEYENNVKFVIVDAEKLFSLAQDAEINTFPSIIFAKKRDIIARVTEPLSIDEIRKKIIGLMIPNVVNDLSQK